MSDVQTANKSHYMSLDNYQLLALRYRKILRDDDKFHIGDETSNAELWAACTTTLLTEAYRDNIVAIATLQAKNDFYYAQDEITADNATNIFKQVFSKSVMTLAKDVVTLQMLENNRNDLPMDLYAPEERALARSLPAVLSLDASITNLAQDYLNGHKDELSDEEDSIESSYAEMPHTPTLSSDDLQSIYMRRVTSKRLVL